MTPIHQPNHGLWGRPKYIITPMGLVETKDWIYWESRKYNKLFKIKRVCAKGNQSREIIGMVNTLRVECNNIHREYILEFNQPAWVPTGQDR